jgi:hypothetical protein
MSFWTTAALLGSLALWPAATMALAIIIATWAVANTYAAKGL